MINSAGHRKKKIIKKKDKSETKKCAYAANSVQKVIKINFLIGNRAIFNLNLNIYYKRCVQPGVRFVHFLLANNMRFLRRVE